MSILPKHSIRCGLFTLCTAAAVGCGSDGVTDPGSISLSIASTGATIMQGASQSVVATLTRIGGFSGTVGFFVTGLPTGVTAAVTDVQTSGAVTTATVGIVVGAAVAPAAYPVLVHGTASGVAEVSKAFTLTVLAGLGFSMTLSTAALSIEQGASTPTTTVNLTRFTHLGGVGLYVTGLPAGVNASFDPTSWPASNSSVLTLTVGATAVPGSYNLQVHAYDPEQEGNVSTPLMLTITAASPGYALTLSSPALIIMQGTSTPTTTVNVVRHNFIGRVGLFLTTGDDSGDMPPEVTAAFAPNSTTGNSSVLTLTVGTAAVPGVYQFYVVGEASTGYRSAALTLTVTTPTSPGYGLTSSASALSVAQGTTSPLTTVDLLRTGFAGNVTLSVDSLPSGASAVFYPVNPTSGSSSRFWVSVDPDAVPGTYSNLLVRGVAPGLADRTAPLTLTITVAPFRLTLSSPTLSIVQGAASPTTTVNVIRDNFTGPVDLHIGWYGEDHDVLPPGVTAAFAPSPVTGNSAVLTFTVGAAATPGDYRLFVFAAASTGWWFSVPLTLTVTAHPPGAPGYTLSLSASTFSIAQIAGSSGTTRSDGDLAAQPGHR